MVAMGDNEVERLKALTLDMLCGAGGGWMTLINIACEHTECDGEVDQDALLVALEELVAEGKVERGDADKYRWMPSQEGESLADKVTRLEAEVERLRGLRDGDRREIAALVERRREPVPSDSAAAERSVTMGLDEGAWVVSLQSTPDWFIVLYRGKSEHDADRITDGVRHIVERILTDHVGQLRDDVERLRARDAKLIADLKAVDAWTGDGDVETLDPLARRLWKQGVDAEGIEVNGAAYVARSLLQDVERLEAERDAALAELQARQEERDSVLVGYGKLLAYPHPEVLMAGIATLRAEQAADRAAARKLVEALPKCERLGCDEPATRGERGYVCDTHSCGDAVELTWGNPLRALLERMKTWEAT